MRIHLFDFSVSTLLAVIPCEVKDRGREFTAFLPIQFFYPVVEFVDDLTVRFRLADRRYCFIPPLRPASRIADAPFFLNRRAARQHKDLCLDFLWIHPWTPPERACFIIKKVYIYHPFHV